MHSTFLKRKRNLKTSKKNNQMLFKKYNKLCLFNDNNSPKNYNSPLSTEKNIVKNLEFNGFNFFKKNKDDDKTLLQIIQNNLINADYNIFQSPNRIISFKENLYYQNKEIKESPLFSFQNPKNKKTLSNEYEKEENDFYSIPNFDDEIKRNNIKFKVLKIINPSKKINKIENNHKVDNLNEKQKIENKKKKENIFKIEKILDKKEYEEGSRIMRKKRGKFPIELQRQIFYNNILKIMRFQNLQKIYFETIKKGKNQLIEKTNEIMKLNNINKEIIKNLIRKKKIRSRHHYIIYTSQAKKFCVDLKEIYNWETEIISLICEVPSKNIKRWCKLGINRKKGGGRKSKYPKLESDLINWYNDSINNNIFPKSNQIREKALELASDVSFLASKTWLEKFKRKYNIIYIPKKDCILIEKIGYKEWRKIKNLNN